MSETTRDAFGPLLNRLQADMRSLRADVRAVRADMGALREDMASRTYVDARVGETEGMIQHLFDQLNLRLDQTERSVEERLTRIEAGRSEP